MQDSRYAPIMDWQACANTLPDTTESAVMHHNAKPLPPVEDLWRWYSYNPLTGQLYSLRRPRPKPVGKQVKGYLYIDNVGYAHRVVWKWVTSNEPGQQLDHINRQRQDNRIANLREADHSLQSQNRDKSKLTKLTPVQVQEIRGLIGTMPQHAIAKRYGVAQSQISCIKTGATHQT